MVTSSIRKPGTAKMLEQQPVAKIIQKIVLVSVILTIYVGICLIGADRLLATITIDYPPSTGYILPLSFFFVTLCIATFITHQQKWPARVTFLFIPVSIFFPLVFFSVYIEIFLSGQTEAITTLAARYCNTEHISDCGPAFANLIMVRGLRAIIPVLTVPPLCYFLHVHWMKTGLLQNEEKKLQKKPHHSIEQVTTQLVRNELLREHIEARFKEGVFYLNVLVLSIVALYTSLLGLEEGQLYALLGSMAIGISVHLKGLARTQGQNQKVKLTILATLICEATLIFGVIVSVIATPQADSMSASLIAVIVCFFTTPLVAKQLSVFLLSRIVLFIVCAAVISINPPLSDTGPQSISEFLAPLIILVLSNIVAGIWTHRTQTSHIRLRLESEVLQLKTQAQNLELERVLGRLRSEEKKNREMYTFRERLFSFLGHDLRQPINAISFLLFKLEQQETEPTRLNSIKLARQSIGSTNRMIEDVLDLAIQDQKEHIVSKETIPVQNLFDILQNEMLDVFKSSGTELKVIRTSICIVTDIQLTLRALRNLLSNVRKYAPGGRCILGVRHRPNYFDIQIVDQGPGIEQSSLEKIFEPFERMPQDKTQRGYGLGLAITKELITTCGGEVLVSSHLGKGTIFSIRFPR